MLRLTASTVPSGQPDARPHQLVAGRLSDQLAVLAGSQIDTGARRWPWTTRRCGCVAHRRRLRPHAQSLRRLKTRKGTRNDNNRRVTYLRQATCAIRMVKRSTEKGDLTWTIESLGLYLVMRVPGQVESLLGMAAHTHFDRAWCCPPKLLFIDTLTTNLARRCRTTGRWVGSKFNKAAIAEHGLGITLDHGLM